MPKKKKTESPRTLSRVRKGLQALSRAAGVRPPGGKGSRPRKKAQGKAAQAGPAVSPRRVSWRKPPRRGQTQVVAFVRDPSCLFTYWEAGPGEVEKIKRDLMEEFKDSQMVLMVFRQGPGGHAELVRELRVEPHEKNRYVEWDGSGGSFFVEIGWKTRAGRRIPLARSNWVSVGEGGRSARTAPEHPDWPVPEELVEYFSPGGALNRVLRGISSAESARIRAGKPVAPGMDSPSSGSYI